MVVGYATDADGIRQGLEQNETNVTVIGARLEKGALAGLNMPRQLWSSYPKLSVIMILDTSSPTMVVEGFSRACQRDHAIKGVSPLGAGVSCDKVAANLSATHKLHK